MTCVTDICNMIDTATDSDNVRQQLKPLTIANLKEIANHYSVHVGLKKKAVYIESIVAATVRSRAAARIIRNY